MFKITPSEIIQTHGALFSSYKAKKINAPFLCYTYDGGGTRREKEKKTVNTCIVNTCMLAFTTIAHRISHGLPIVAADPGKSA